MTIRHTLLVAVTLSVSFPALAGGLPQPGDFYFISRERHGTFVGSHKLYLEFSKGLRQVRYCERDYYVRSHSVAWTQFETQLGRKVQIEFNFGRGWRPICDRPQDQVALADLGIAMAPEEFLQQSNSEEQTESRFSAISGVFNKKKTHSRDQSYHSR